MQAVINPPVRPGRISQFAHSTEAHSFQNPRGQPTAKQYGSTSEPHSGTVVELLEITGLQASRHSNRAESNKEAAVRKVLNRDFMSSWVVWVLWVHDEIGMQISHARNCYRLVLCAGHLRFITTVQGPAFLSHETRLTIRAALTAAYDVSDRCAVVREKS